MLLAVVVAAMAVYLYMNRNERTGNAVVTQNMMLFGGAVLIAVAIYSYMKRGREGIAVQGLGETRDVVVDGPSRYTIESAGHNPNATLANNMM